MARSIARHALTRILLLLAIPVFSAAALYLVALKVQDQEAWVTHTVQVQLSLEKLVAGLERAEASQRMYLLTSEERLLEPYHAALSQTGRELAAIGASTRDNPRQQRALEQLRSLFDQRRAHFEETIRFHRLMGRTTAMELERVDAGKLITDRILTAIDGMRKEEDALLRQRQSEASRATSLFFWSLAGGFVAMILLVLSLYRGVQRFSAQSAEAERKLSLLNADLERRVEERTARLQAGEALLQSFVKYVPAAVAMVDREMRYLQVSDRWCADFSLGFREILGRSHYEIFPDLPERWKALYGRCLAGETLHADEDCWERPDGDIWLRWDIRPWGEEAGLPRGILIFSEDISGRKRIEATLRESEASLRALAASLLTAQEDERRRVARELHDSVTQRLALLSIETGKIAADPFSTGEQVRMWAGAFQQQLLHVSQEVRRLSHGLHPSIIEDLGLSAALEEFCEEFERAHSITVRFRDRADGAELSRSGAACLYRIAQEAVWNAVRHAHATEIRVTLVLEGNCLVLRVKDDGSGFAPETRRTRAGLGFVSMKERINLVQGTFDIWSNPGSGTEITAAVPLGGGAS